MRTKNQGGDMTNLTVRKRVMEDLATSNQLMFKNIQQKEVSALVIKIQALVQKEMEHWKANPSRLIREMKRD